MKNIIVYLVCSFLFVSFLIPSLFAQTPDSLWYKTFGNVMDDMGFDALENEDGDYMVVGKTEVSNTNWDAWIAKLDNNGNLIWENAIGGVMDEQIVSVCPALYSGYVMTGYTSTDANGLSDIWILYVDENGDSVASVKYGGMTSDQGDCIRPTIDQGFILSAYTSVYLMGDQIYLMKLDISLDTLWTKTFGGPMHDYGHWVEETSDYGYIIAGRTYTTQYLESGDAWVIKTDNNGDTVWTKKYGGDDEDIFFALVETDDGYIFAGQTWSFGAGLIDMYVIRTDDNGNVIWAKTFGGTGADYAYNIFETEDGNYTVSGYSDSFSGSQDVYLIKIDGDGNLIWEKYYGDHLDNEYMYGGTATSDGGYLFTGRLDYYISAMDDIFVLKLGPEIQDINANIYKSTDHLTISPNPAKSQVHISTQYSAGIEHLTIYDLRGNKIFGFIKRSGTQNKEFCLDVTDFLNGIYIVEVISGTSVFSAKFVKQ